MPLIIVCGRPCTGKSTVSHALGSYLGQRGLAVEVVSEESCSGASGDRGAALASPASEKTSRARFKSSVERCLGSGGAGRVVIADGCNASKGFRYELSILARNAATPSACLWVGSDVSLAVAQGVNGARQGREGSSSGSAPSPYPARCLQDQWLRFEPPDARNRWDSPLLRLPLAAGLGQASLQRLAAQALLLPLPCAPSARGSSSSSSSSSACSWWAPAGAAEAEPQAAAGGPGAAAVPLLTSRFALTQLQASSELALASGTGAVVEALGVGARRASRQAADSSAGYGAVPLRGFSAAAGRGGVGSSSSSLPGGGAAASAAAPPDYFAEDFNGDRREEEEEEEGGVDIADLRDFEGLEQPFTEGPESGSSDSSSSSAFTAATPALPLKAAGSSFKRATATPAATAAPSAAAPTAAAPTAAPPQPSFSAQPLTATTATSSTSSTTPLPPHSEGDALEVAQAWLLQFLLSGGRQQHAHCSPPSAAASGAAAASDTLLLHAQAGSGAVLGVVEEALRIGALTQGDFLAIPGSRVLLRLARVPTSVEVHRLRREWLAAVGLQEGGSSAAGAGISDSASAAKAFTLHVNAALRSSMQ